MLLKHYKFIDLTQNLSENVPTWNGSCGFCLEIKKDYEVFAIPFQRLHQNIRELKYFSLQPFVSRERRMFVPKNERNMSTCPPPIISKFRTTASTTSAFFLNSEAVIFFVYCSILSMACKLAPDPK
jgi:hypothetical protein